MPIYDTIKAQEVNFPLPRSTETITVGTLNAQTGVFHYSVPIYHQGVAVAPTLGVGGSTKPEHERFTGGRVDTVNVFAVILRFQVTGRQGNFTVSVQGHSTIQVAADVVEVNVGAATSAIFSLTCNGQTFHPELPLKITRHIAATGAITIPALPVTIIYAPPVDQQRKNVASWTGTDLTGNTTSVSFSEEHSTTVPAPSPFEPWLELTSEMRVASGVLSHINNPFAQAVGVALGVISGLLGSSTVTQGSGPPITDQTPLTVTLSSQTTVETNPEGGGPGAADVLVFLKNAKICWFTDGGPLKLALLGWDAVDMLTASFLHDPMALTGIDQATRDALLNLDPFVAGGPGALLFPPRYRYVATFDVNATFTYTLSYTISNTDRAQTVRTTFGVEDDTASFLAFANIGVTQTLKAQSIMTQKSTSEKTTATTITRQFRFFANPTEYYTVEVYCDVIFGTFAFRTIGTVPFHKIKGRVFDVYGGPLPHSEVTLFSRGQQFTTATDANGEFSFRAATIGSGRALLKAGTARLDLDVRGQPLHNIELRNHSHSASA